MRILVTGGAGFIGCNLAARAVRLGHDVTVFDNLSRPGTDWNLEWLRSVGSFDLVKEDVRDFSRVLNAVQSWRFDAVFHQAGQVAVTTSVQDPRSDFEINALGTFNLLEAIRLTKHEPVVVFASTNKVYGSLSHLGVMERDGRYTLEALPHGVSESEPIGFLAPYGCSKGAADQYVLDYRRMFGLRTIVFRQSCIYGPRQIGLEDQGWVAWFALCAKFDRSITIYGDGKQVRDVLYIDDLVDLYFRAVHAEPSLRSFVFNVGGGSRLTASLREVVRLLEREVGRPIGLRYSEWRPGDQRVYVSDIRRTEAAFHWSPGVTPEDGVSRLLGWIGENRKALGTFVSDRPATS